MDNLEADLHQSHMHTEELGLKSFHVNGTESNFKISIGIHNSFASNTYNGLNLELRTKFGLNVQHKV